MTREEARKAAEVMLAYAEGKEIETLSNGEYIPCGEPHFNWIRYKYRIKSKQRELDPKISQTLDNALERASITPEDVLSAIKLAYASGEDIRVALMNFLNEKKCSVKPKPKFDPKTLQPFDKVLARDSKSTAWRCDFFSHSAMTGYPYTNFCVNSYYKFVIPYNEDTKHLLGTANEAPEFYRDYEN